LGSRGIGCRAGGGGKAGQSTGGKALGLGWLAKQGIRHKPRRAGAKAWAVLG